MRPLRVRSSAVSAIDAARPISAHAPHAIAVAGRPSARRQWVNKSSQLFAAELAPWPGLPSRAAAEENEQNQSSGCPSVALCRCHAPYTLGAQSRSMCSSLMLVRVASSTTAAACSTPRSGSPVAVATSTHLAAVAASAMFPHSTSNIGPGGTDAVDHFPRLGVWL